ncbi:MAG: hypothetical protein Q8911_01345 [Bacillota bacterium]|nr:hypothetical protein [Bacillota bacterium]
MPANPKCHRYKEKSPEDKPTCINCYNWLGMRCKYHEEIGEGNREIERLMMHDGYRRERGGIRQTRRG